MKNERPYFEKPCACHPFKSYRYKKKYGELFTGNSSFIMIGAKDNEDAINEVLRSISYQEIDYSCLQIWDGQKYISAFQFDK